MYLDANLLHVNRLADTLEELLCQNKQVCVS